MPHGTPGAPGHPGHPGHPEPPSGSAGDPHFTVERVGSVHLVRFRLDLYEAEEVERVHDAIAALIDAAAPPPRLVIDLGRLRLATSRIFGVLMNFHLRAVKRGGGLWLTGLSPGIRETMTLIRLDRVFRVAATAEEALRDAEQPHS